MKISQQVKPIHVRLIVSKEARGWILGKIAERLKEHLTGYGIIADIGDRPIPDVDINHYLLYHNFATLSGPRSTIGITHIDDFRKVQLIRKIMSTADAGICMSSDEAAKLIKKGCPREKMCYISPAHDAKVGMRRTKIGITTRLYPDGRKREQVLLDAATKVSLESFHFEIYGDGWQRVIAKLELNGATVEYHPMAGAYRDEYEILKARIPHFDYYLYPGCDEGSLGTLDALSAGVPTIVTPQGFHLDIPGGITHPFMSSNELAKILSGIAEKREKRVCAVAEWNWDNYARKHALLWMTLTRRELRTPSDILGCGDLIERRLRDGIGSPRIGTRFDYYSRPFLLRLKQWLGMKNWVNKNRTNQ